MQASGKTVGVSQTNVAEQAPAAGRPACTGFETEARHFVPHLQPCGARAFYKATARVRKGESTERAGSGTSSDACEQ